MSMASLASSEPMAAMSMASLASLASSEPKDFIAEGKYGKVFAHGEWQVIKRFVRDPGENNAFF